MVKLKTYLSIVLLMVLAQPVHAGFLSCANALDKPARKLILRSKEAKRQEILHEVKSLITEARVSWDTREIVMAYPNALARMILDNKLRIDELTANDWVFAKDTLTGELIALQGLKQSRLFIRKAISFSGKRPRLWNAREVQKLVSFRSPYQLRGGKYIHMLPVMNPLDSGGTVDGAYIEDYSLKAPPAFGHMYNIDDSLSMFETMREMAEINFDAALAEDSQRAKVLKPYRDEIINFILNSKGTFEHQQDLFAFATKGKVVKAVEEGTGKEYIFFFQKEGVEYNRFTQEETVIYFSMNEKKKMGDTMFLVDVPRVGHSDIEQSRRSFLLEDGRTLVVEPVHVDVIGIPEQYQRTYIKE